MRKIFEEYGGVITTVIAVVCLIALVTFLMSSNGAVSKAFTDIVNKFVGASSELLDSSVETSAPVETFYKQNPQNLSFRSSAPIEELQTVKVNGEAIDSANYTLSDEGTTITLKVEYLGTLPEGTYTVKIESASGSLTVTFKVVAGGSGSGEQGGVALPAVGTSAEDCTWEQITAIGEAGKADEYFDLGDTKTIALNADTSIVMEIAAFNADTKSNGSGTAAITWISRDLVAMRQMNSTDTAAGGWEASELRTWLRSDFFATLPSDVQKSIVAVNKTYYENTSRTTQSCEDTVWIPSAYEVFGKSTDRVAHEGSGIHYKSYFSDSNALARDFDDTTSTWWLRTANSAAENVFLVVLFNTKSGSESPTASRGVLLGFCT